MAFKHCISFATDLAAKFGCNRFRITPDIVSSFCSPPPEVAALFDSNLSRCPFLGQVLNSDLLLCTGFDWEHAVLFLCHMFTQGPMTDTKIEQSYGRCLGRQQLLAISMEISFRVKKQKRLVAALYLQSIKTLLTLELRQYSKSGSMFSSCVPVAASSDCSRLGNTIGLCSPVRVRPAQAEQKSCPMSLAVDFAL